MNKEEAIKKMKDSMGNWGLTQEFWEDVDSVLEQYAQQVKKEELKKAYDAGKMDSDPFADGATFDEWYT